MREHAADCIEAIDRFLCAFGAYLAGEDTDIMGAAAVTPGHAYALVPTRPPTPPPPPMNPQTATLDISILRLLVRALKLGHTVPPRAMRVLIRDPDFDYGMILHTKKMLENFDYQRSVQDMYRAYGPRKRTRVSMLRDSA